MLLSAAMVIAMLPGMSMVAKAEEPQDDSQVYSIETDCCKVDIENMNEVPVKTVVTITAVAPGTGASFDHWEIKKKEDNTVTDEVTDELLGNDDNKKKSSTTTFEMPSYNIYVLAVFILNAPDPQDDSTEYSIDCDINCTANKSKAIAGDPVEITAVADPEGKSFAQWSIRKYTDNAVDDDPDVTDELLNSNNKNTSPTTFNMPAYNIYVKAGFSSEAGSGTSITYSDAGWTGIDNSSMLQAPFTIYNNSSNNLNVKVDNTAVDKSIEPGQFLKMVAGEYTVVTLEAKNLVLHLVGEGSGSGSGSEGGSGSDPGQSQTEKKYTLGVAASCTATIGSETVTGKEVSVPAKTSITITVADMSSDSNRRFDYWKITEDSATGTDITSTILSGDAAKNSSITFSMPAKNIYVTPAFESESSETTEMPTGGLFAGKFGKYQVFDVSRSPAYPAGTQENPSKFTVSNFKAPFGVGTSITEDGWFYFKPSANQTIRYNSSWGVDGAYIVELWYNDNHGYDEKVNSGVIGGIADEGFFYEGDSRYGYYFSNNAGYEYGFSELTYTPEVRVVCDVDVLTNYTAGSMLVPEGYNTDEESNTNESTASISLSGETAVKNETPVVPGLDAEATSEGEDVSLNLQIAVEPEATLEASPTLNSEPDIKEKVKNQFKDESTVKVDVLNINLRKLVEGIFKEYVTSTNSVLEIGIGYDFEGKYDPSLVSKHGDDVRTFATLTARPSAGNYRNGTFFPDVANGKFYIYSSDFSEFVISYSTVEGNAQNRSVIDPNASSGSSSASVATNTAPKATPVYRLFNLQKGYHFFTTNLAEKEALVAAGWTDEGVAWYTPTNAGKPVYRLFDKTKGGHIFTTDAAQKDACIAAGSTDEGIAWYGLDTGRTVYKITNPKLGRGLYTVNPAEKDALAALGFTVEEADFKVN